VSQAPSDEAYTLGLLVDLRDLCRKIGDDHFRMAAELHDLLRQVAHPSLCDVDKELTFRVQQQAFGEYGETIRTISLNGNRDVAHAAFDAAVKCYPYQRWFLLWGSYIVKKHEPESSKG
jgi:hypothetical protein